LILHGTKPFVVFGSRKDLNLFSCLLGDCFVSTHALAPSSFFQVTAFIISGKLRWEFIGHSARVLSFAISPDGKTLVSGSLDTRIKVWDLQTGRAVRTLEGHWGWVKSLIISRDGKTLISASYKEIRVWNLETGAPIQVLHGHINLINAIALSHDGQTLVSGGEDANIHIWRVP